MTANKDGAPPSPERSLSVQAARSRRLLKARSHVVAAPVAASAAASPRATRRGHTCARLRAAMGTTAFSQRGKHPMGLSRLTVDNRA